MGEIDLFPRCERVVIHMGFADADMRMASPMNRISPTTTIAMPHTVAMDTALTDHQRVSWVLLEILAA